MRKQFVKKRLKRGLVFRIPVPDLPYRKFFIFMGYDAETKEAVGFLISSPKKKPALAGKNLIVEEYQLLIGSRDHSFLKYDSIINCFSLFSLSLYDVVNGLTESPAKICGDLSSEMLSRVLEVSETNPSFSLYERKIITGPLTLPDF